MITQRKTKNLGINRSKDKELIYAYLEKHLGIKNKTCSRATSNKNSKYDFKHEGPASLPIRQFNLEGAFVNTEGKIISSKKIPLQPYCIACERKYRRGRLNKWNDIYSKMSDAEVYASYKEHYGSTCHCSRCNKDKSPEEFAISKKMDKGLHNVCKSCSKSYTEAVGNRWIIYSPDGHEVIEVLDTDKCTMCGSKEKLHKDHIWPISKGGTDNKENIQILCGTHNLSKSDTIIGIKNINDINQKMVCERYANILRQAKKEKWSVAKFESEICKGVKDFISWKKKLDDKQLGQFFEGEKRRNNRKHDVEHAVKKFRKYCDTAIIDLRAYFSKS